MLNEALLQEEEERKALAELDQQVNNLEQRRLVAKNNSMKFRNFKMATRGDNKKVALALPARGIISHPREHKGELAGFERRGTETFLLSNKQSEHDRVAQWLASSEDTSMFHETRSEPGEFN